METPQFKMNNNQIPSEPPVHSAPTTPTYPDPISSVPMLEDVGRGDESSWKTKILDNKLLVFGVVILAMILAMAVFYVVSKGKNSNSESPVAVLNTIEEKQAFVSAAFLKTFSQSFHYEGVITEKASTDHMSDILRDVKRVYNINGLVTPANYGLLNFILNLNCVLDVNGQDINKDDKLILGTDIGFTVSKVEDVLYLSPTRLEFSEDVRREILRAQKMEHKDFDNVAVGLLQKQFIGRHFFIPLGGALGDDFKEQDESVQDMFLNIESFIKNDVFNLIDLTDRGVEKVNGVDTYVFTLKPSTLKIVQFLLKEYSDGDLSEDELTEFRDQLNEEFKLNDIVFNVYIGQRDGFIYRIDIKDLDIPITDSYGGAHTIGMKLDFSPLNNNEKITPPSNAESMDVFFQELSSLVDNKDLDSDNDGLKNFEEYLYNTDPNNPDTDGDGYLDGNEVEHGYDPTIPGSARLPGK